MKTTVKDVLFRDEQDGPVMNATVVFYEDDAYYHRSAEVKVYVEKTVTDVQELKARAIEKALDFLTAAQSAHSDKDHLPANDK